LNVRAALEHISAIGNFILRDLRVAFLLGYERMKVPLFARSSIAAAQISWLM
jgi:hypothetical protein